jgi:hypothetical protein
MKMSLESTSSFLTWSPVAFSEPSSPYRPVSPASSNEILPSVQAGRLETDSDGRTGATHGAGDDLAGELDAREDEAQVLVGVDLLLGQDVTRERDGVRVVDLLSHGDGHAGVVRAAQKAGEADGGARGGSEQREQRGRPGKTSRRRGRSKGACVRRIRFWNGIEVHNLQPVGSSMVCQESCQSR